MLNMLLDPRFFNVIIILMFITASLRWAYEKNWAQATYWCAAAVLNVAVTFMAAK
jgi:Flp pilus assembly protein protease CpaA